MAELSPDDQDDVRRAIQATAATGPRQRNKGVFAFARRLKAIEALRHRPGPALRELVRAWWEASLLAIRTKDFSDTYADFLRAWEAVRIPWNEDFMMNMIEQARARPCLTGLDERTDVLAALCRELQVAAGTEPFYLSVRCAAKPFGETPAWGAGRLRVLEAEGWIRAVERGGPGTQRATRWRFIGPPGGPQVTPDRQTTAKPGSDPAGEIGVAGHD